MKKVILIGESPNWNTEHHPELWLRPDRSGACHSANRLLTYTGWTLEEYLAWFDRTNLVRRAVTKWPREEAAHASVALFIKAASSGQKVIQAFFGSRKIALLKWKPLEVDGLTPLNGPAHFAVVPHPSGRNLWWNSKEHRAQALAFFTHLKSELSRTE
jgi:hypothetical protein